MEKDGKKLSDEELSSVAGGSLNGQQVRIINCKQSVVVRSSSVNTDNSNIIGYAHLGALYPYVGRSGNWIKIKFGSRTGYVYKDFISLE